MLLNPIRGFMEFVHANIWAKYFAIRAENEKTRSDWVQRLSFETKFWIVFSAPFPASFSLVTGFKPWSSSVGAITLRIFDKISWVQDWPNFRLTEFQIDWLKRTKNWAVVVVKRSACSPSTLTIRVRILLTSTVFSVKFVFEKDENKQKRGRGWPIF